MDNDIQGSFASRTIFPFMHRLLSLFGSFAPKNSLGKIDAMLVRAGSPGGLTALDFVGLRLLLAGVTGLVCFVVFAPNGDVLATIRNTFIGVFVSFMAPKFWLSRRIKKRRTEIARALPDALDMLTIGVAAGLAFESALLRVGDQWNNALSQEFRRVVSELRLGIGRNEALRHMIERCQVEDLSTFVAVLIQSNTLGMSIAQVLHAQADQMRLKRRQNAEEQAHAATVKIVLVLAMFIFPALFIVILGPVVPELLGSLQNMSR